MPPNGFWSPVLALDPRDKGNGCGRLLGLPDGKTME